MFELFLLEVFQLLALIFRGSVISRERFLNSLDCVVFAENKMRGALLNVHASVRSPLLTQKNFFSDFGIAMLFGVELGCSGLISATCSMWEYVSARSHYSSVWGKISRERCREVAGAFHISSADKSDHTANSGELGGAAFLNSASEISLSESHCHALGYQSSCLMLISGSSCHSCQFDNWVGFVGVWTGAIAYDEAIASCWWQFCVSNYC